jgi:hypothetical protein
MFLKGNYIKKPFSATGNGFFHNQTGINLIKID